MAEPGIISIRKKTILLVLAVVVVLGIVGFIGSEWYTHRPQFCRSCHNMEVQYLTWEKSKHKEVSCHDCHYPPGEGSPTRGTKFRMWRISTIEAA
jgi:nitrate/TMAO reductase-like tetraheme cytochrome c subunit